MIKFLLLAVLLALAACTRQEPEAISEAPREDAAALVATSIPPTTTPRPTATASPMPPTPAPSPTPTLTPTMTPTATTVPNEASRLISVVALDVLGKDPVEAVTLATPLADGGQETPAIWALSGIGPGNSLVVTIADRDGNAQRAWLNSADGRSLSAGLQPPRDAVMKPLEGSDEPLYEIHFFRSSYESSVVEIGELAETELTLTIEDADGARTSETILLSRHSYEEGEGRPAQLAAPWFEALQWEATAEAGGLTFVGPLAEWLNANPQVAGNLYFVIAGQAPFSWQDSLEQPGLLQERLLLTGENQPLELHYMGPNLEKQLVTTLSAPFYNRFRFVTDARLPSITYLIAAPRDEAVSELDLDNTAAAVARLSRHNSNILVTLNAHDLFFALSAGDLHPETHSSLNGDRIWIDEGVLADACGLYGYKIDRGFLLVEEKCLGYEPSYPGGVVIHELGHAVAYHVLREDYVNLASVLAAYSIDPPFQWPSVEEELQWGDETWAHVVEAWFGYDSEFWWFWETDRPGTGRLFDIIELEDGRPLRQFMFDLFGPPQDMDGNEYPEAAGSG